MRLLYESHLHTPLCKHAQGEPEAYAAVAETRGLKGIIVTCHNPPVDGWEPGVRMAEDQFDTYVEMVEQARAAWTGRIDVRLGLECDYVPGHEAGIERQLARAEFHLVLGSVHPQLPGYRERYFTGDMATFQRTYFDHLAQAAESGLFDTVAHPDLIKNEDANNWNPEEARGVIASTLDRIAKTGVAMELNTSGLNKRYREMNPGRLMLEEMQARDIPVVVGADAHVPARVADRYTEALLALQEVGYRNVHVTLERRRVPIAIDDALASLQPVVV